MASESQIESSATSASDSILPKPIFHRPNKKRKIYRRQHSDEDVESASLVPSEPQPQSLDELIASSSAPKSAHSGEDSLDEYGEKGKVSMAELLRLRKLRKQRAGGVEFRADGVGRHGLMQIEEADGDGNGIEPRNGDAIPAVAAVRKFAPQTGTVGDVNKHMMAYVDSEMAKRRSQAMLANAAQSLASSSDTSSILGRNEITSQATATISSQVIANGKRGLGDIAAERQPAALGKLLEIDLGEESRTRNIELTNRARLRLDGEGIDGDSGSGSGGSQKKVRLGKDGKSWKGRKRRGSDDIKRDKLVEEVLRENRLEIYEPPPPTAETNDDQAADDRIAEEFKREFLDAMSARQRKKNPPAQSSGRGPGGKKEDEVLKGPKLGGSRSARAAMRDQMLKNAKK
ncbi:hypothetical protein F5884DRAFT_851542 [Xylogone sp. PMI_703]|nr:hypothetical protein F5884DRAFT_851542 [Xylogone sp. PMI_703]